MYNKWIVLVILICLAHVVMGKAYYIANSGSDAADGLSPATAWQTVTKRYSVTLKPGDSLLLKGGETFSGLIYLAPGEAGTITQPILISSYGSGIATINAGMGAGIFGYNNGGITIRNLIIKGAGDNINTGSGIFFYIDTPGNINLRNIIIDSVEASGFQKSGIELYALPNDQSRSGISNIIITHAVLHDNGSTGINIWGNFKNSDAGYNYRNVYIGHCKAYNNRGLTNNVSGSGIQISQVDSGVIEYCEAYNNGVTGAGGVGIWAWDANRIIIQHCESHHNHTTGSDGDGFDLDGGVTNSIMQYNYSHDNDGAAYLIWQFDGARPYHNNVVRYNISENDSRKHNGYYGMVAIGAGDSATNSGIQNVLIYNNTLYKNKIPGNDSMQGPAVSLQGDLISGIKLYNNIFVLEGTSRFEYAYNKVDAVLTNNIYWSNKGFWITDAGNDYYDLNSWTTATGQEMNMGRSAAHLSDPLLLNAGNAGTIGNTDSLQKLIKYYGLKNNSPAIDSGTNLLIAYGINPGTVDFSGHILPSGPAYDIGACEYTFVTGIPSSYNETVYSIYPNPAQGIAYVTSAHHNLPFRVKIYDVQGRCIYTTEGSDKLEINTTEYLPGLYHLVIIDTKGNAYYRLMKH